MQVLLLRWVTLARPYLAPGKRYLILHFPRAVFPMGSWLSTPVTADEGEDIGLTTAALQQQLDFTVQVLLW